MLRSLLPSCVTLTSTFAAGLALGACRQDDPNHCLNNGGDAYCQEKTGLAEGQVFCTNNCGGDYDASGCLVADVAPASECWACTGEDSQNCDGVADTGSETASETATDTGTTSETATDTATESTTTEGPECMDSSMCGGETPLCEGGSCVGCGEGVMTSCASEYPATPACDAGTGTCVMCTSEDSAACGGMTPVCEGNVCVGCDEHDECPESACNMSTGACMPVDRVWWVNQSVVGPGTGTMADPYKNASQALSNIGAGEWGTLFIATPNTHQEQLVILGNRTVAILGASELGTLKQDGAATIDVNQDALTFLGNLKVKGGDNVGVRCSGGMIWIDGSQVGKNSDGDIQIISGTVNINNSFVGGNLANFSAINLIDGALNITYGTVAGGALNSAAINCADGSGVVIRNSLIVSAQGGAELSCPGAQITSSALEMDVPGNTALGDMPDFMWFEDYVEGDFSLTANAPVDIATAATWQTGDPATDIDGDARPTVDGTPDYAGADIPN